MKYTYILVIIILGVLINLGKLNGQTSTENENEKKNPFSISGAVSVSGFYNNTNRNLAFIQPYGYGLNIDINTSIYGIDIPMQLSLNQQGTDLRTPFNRFGISPKYKWITLHLGYRNYNWSEFLMAGATVYGAGLELDFKGYQVAGVYGQLRKAISSPDANYPFQQFSRSIQAARIGKEAKFFHFYLDVMKGKDDINSLSSLSTEARDRLEAQDNFGIGIQVKIPIKKDKIYIESEGALSIFTDDIRNETISLDSFPEFAFIDKVLDVKLSTHYGTAFKHGLYFNFDQFKINAQYRTVSSGFKSLGTNYLLSDIQTITINPTFNLWKNKMVISGSLGLMYNNLDERLINKTQRQIGSVNLNINPSPTFGASIQYANYSIYQQVIKDSLTYDSTLIDQVNHNISFVPRITIINDSYVHNLVFNANYQILDDNNDLYSEYTESNLYSLNANYTLTFIQSQLNLNVGINYLNFSSAAFTSDQKGANIGINKKFFNQKLSVGVRGNYSILNSNEISNNLSNVMVKLGYQLFKNSSINFQVVQLNNESETNPIKETRSQLNYRHTF